MDGRNDTMILYLLSKCFGVLVLVVNTPTTIFVDTCIHV